MAIEIDPAGLRTRAASLRTVANDLDYTRSEIISALALIGQSSGSTSALSGVVSALRSRATDLEYRASFVERLQPIELVATAPSWSPVSYGQYADASLSDVQLLVDDLGYRIDTWSGSDNDPILDEMIAAKRALEYSAAARATTPLAVIEREIAELEAIAGYVGVSHLITEKKAELAELTAAKIDALRQALATVEQLENIPYGGTAEVAQMYGEARAEVAALQAELGVTADDFRAAVAAMQAGMTPEEAGLSDLLFDPAYLERLALLEEAQAAVRVLEAERDHIEAYANGEIQDPDLDGQNNLLRWYVLEEEIAAAMQVVEGVRRDIAPPIGELSAWIDGFDLIDSSAGDSIFANTLLEYAVDGESVDVVAVADALGQVDAAAAGAFFSSYGPQGVANLTWEIVEEFHFEHGAGVPTLRTISVALGDAQRAGHLGFRGSALLNQVPGGYLPAHLFRFGDFTSSYLAEAAAFVLEEGETEHLHMSAMFDTPSLLELGDPWPFDARLILLERVAEESAASLQLLQRLAGGGTMASLIDPELEYLHSEGEAAGQVLIHVGVAAADEDQGGRYTDLLAQVVMTTSEVEKTEAGVANGLATMLLPHLSAFVPEFPKSLGSSYVRDLERPPLADALAVHGMDHDGVYRAVFDAINNSGGSDALEVVVRDWVATMLLLHHDPNDPSQIQPMAADIGAVVGLYVDSAFDFELEDAQRQDTINGLLRTATRVISTAAIVAGTGGVGTLAQLGFRKWAARQILKGAVGGAASQLFPIDNAEGVLIDQINSVHTEITTANMLFIELQGPDFFDPPYPFVDDSGYVMEPPSVEAFHEWKLEVIENGYDYELAALNFEILVLGQLSQIDAED